MADAIETSDSIFHRVPRHRVFSSQKLAGPWEEIPFLYCDRLRVACAPEIDEAHFRYDYGPALREGKTTKDVYAPLELNGQFVKVVVEEAGIDDSDVVWYGLAEVDDRRAGGSGRNKDKPTGRQTIVAYGLLRLLERQIIRTSTVHNATAGAEPEREVDFGIPFNNYRGGEFNDRGNRADQRLNADPQKPFVFSNLPQRTNKWNARTAAEYLLHFHQPKDGLTAPICEWAIDATENALEWYDVSVDTDGRSVKDVLDELISRRRGVGYYVDYDEVNNTATVRVFTFIDAPLLLKSGVTIPQNQRIVSLDFEKAIDAEVRLVNQVTSRFDRVVAIGAYATTTCTLSFLESRHQIKADWTTAERQAYFDAASAESGYGSQDPREKARRNQRFRDSASLQNVYRRFQIDPDWNQRTLDPDATGSSIPEYFVNPHTALLSDGTVSITSEYNANQQSTAIPLWNEGIILEHALPLKDRFDYTGNKIRDVNYASNTGDGEPAYLRPLVFVRTTSGATAADNRWEFLDRLSQAAVFENENRRWAGHIRILDQRPAFDVELSGVPQHFLDKSTTFAMAEYDAYHDPNKEAGIVYQNDMRATLCLRLQHRVEEEALVGVDLVDGRPLRTLYISVPDARLDYVVPKTAVTIRDGVITLSDSGGFVNDHRVRLADIARAAAEWYGRPRQTIMMGLRQIQEFVKLGWLINDVGSKYTISGVNTPITAISYDFLHVSTEFETAYAEMEFV